MPSHDWGHGETDAEAAARETASAEADLREWEAELAADRLRRDWPARMWCGICGEQPGLSIYGLKCAGCFELQREERAA